MKALRPRDLAFAIVALVSLFAVVVARLAPPSALPIDAAPERFSAMRAAAILDDLLGDGAPHPVASVANARVRERIVARLEALGFAPEAQHEFVCGEYGTCAPVVNVIARHEGREAGPAVALVAHYDSVPAGPGAADDGSGVATLLEIARILRLGPPPNHPVILLFTDGEEAGLLGARAFVERHPMALDIRAVVNVEARGTRGPSLLFETRGNDAWLVDLYAQYAPHPVISSLFSAVYEQMPNDSDLSVFARQGIPGVNFAFLGGIAHYHTPLDDLAHLRLDSLQDHGEHALAMTRALASSELSAPSPGKAVYFDLLSLGIVRWPTGRSLPLALLAWGSTLLALFALSRQGRCTLEGALRGLSAFLVSPALALVTSWGFGQALLLLGVTRNWVAYPAPALVGFVAIGILSVTLSASFTRGGPPLGTHAGISLGLSSLAVLVSIVLPGASYLLLIPALGAAAALVFALLPAPRKLSLPILLALPALLSGLVWFPILALLYDAVGLAGMPILAAAVALVLGSLLPFSSSLKAVTERRLALAPALVALVTMTVTPLGPLSSMERPERLSLALHHDADARVSHWLAKPESGSLPEPMREVAAFGSRMTATLPGLRGAAFMGPADVSGLSLPEVTAIERLTVSGLRQLRFRVATEEPSTLTLAFPSDAPIHRLTVLGEGVTPRREARWQLVTLFGVGKEGMDISVSLGSAAAPLEMTIVSAAPGLPAEGSALLSSRPKSAVPTQDGDRTLVSRRVEL